MKNILRPVLVIFALLTLVTGIAYPFVVTGLAQALFPMQAAGSVILRDGKPVGSSLIGQSFSQPGHFWSRPSATSPMANNATSSGGSNLGPLNPALVDAVKARVDALRAADPGNASPVPVDLVTASASGLDPHISLAAAYYQVGRIAKARGLAADRVRGLVDANAERPLIGIVGEVQVNVLQLNLALNAMK